MRIGLHDSDNTDFPNRVLALRNAGVNPFAQPYRDFTTNAEPERELKDFARWVNDKAIFKSVETFKDYKGRKGGDRGCA